MACSVQYLMCRMKCTCAESSAFAFAFAVPNVHCAVCKVQCQPTKEEYLAVKKNESNLNLIYKN